MISSGRIGNRRRRCCSPLDGCGRTPWRSCSRCGRDPSRRAPLNGLEVVSLTGLPAAAAGMLPGLGADGAARLVAGQTSGNPLALPEITERLTPAQRRGRPAAEPAAGYAATGTRLSNELPDRAVASGCGRSCCSRPASRSRSPLRRWPHCARTARTPTRPWTKPRSAACWSRDRGALRFRHPLLRIGRLGLAAPAQRRAAHRALADALPGAAARAARSWHLAEATERSRRRSGRGARSRGRRGAALPTRIRIRVGRAGTGGAADHRPGAGGRRLAAAVSDAFLAGDLERTRVLAARVLAGGASAACARPVLFHPWDARAVRRLGAARRGPLAAAAELAQGRQRMLGGSAELGGDSVPPQRAGRPRECADRIAGVAELSDPQQRMLSDFAGGFASQRGSANRQRGAAADAGPWGSCVPVAARRPSFPDRTCSGRPRSWATRRAAWHRGRDRDALGGGARARRPWGPGARRWPWSPPATPESGTTVGAFADAGEAAELGEQLGYAADAAVAVEMLAWQSAARGLHDDARRALERARALADRAGTTAYRAHWRSRPGSARCGGAIWRRPCRCSRSASPPTAGADREAKPSGSPPT